MPFKDKEEKRKYERQYYQANRQKKLDRVNGYRKENPETIAETKRRHREANKEKIAEADRLYRKANPDKVRINNHRQRSRREKTTEGDFTSEQWRLLCVKYNYTCLCCGTKAEGTPEGAITIDHVIPLSKGGSNHISNIQPLCQSCNSRKRQKTTDYRPSHALVFG